MPIKRVRKDYYPSGALRRNVTFMDDVQEGPTIEFYETGAIRKRVEYVNGQIEGVAHEFYDTGELWVEEVYRQGILQGTVRSYYKNGTIQSELNYTGGKLHGECKVYYGSGILKKIGNFKLGRPLGPAKIYHETGGLKRKGDFFNEDDVRDEVVYEKGIRAERVSSNRLLQQFLILAGIAIVFSMVMNPETGIFRKKSKEQIKYELRSGGSARDSMLPPENPEDGITKTYYPTGELYAEWSYLNGEQDGVTKKYFKNGQMQSSISYRMGLLDGPSIIYHENGRVLSNNIYKDGFIVKEEQTGVAYGPDGERIENRIMIEQKNPEEAEEAFKTKDEPAGEEERDASGPPSGAYMIDQSELAQPDAEGQTI